MPATAKTIIDQDSNVHCNMSKHTCDCLDLNAIEFQHGPLLRHCFSGPMAEKAGAETLQQCLSKGRCWNSIAFRSKQSQVCFDMLQ